MKTPKTYSEAWQELNEILASIEAEQVDIDNLSEKLKRSAFLVKFCQTRLRSAEKDMEAHFEEE